MTDALLIVNNVPTPYRAFLFNQLSAAGVERGVQVEVLFQARRLLAHPEWSGTPLDHRFVSGVSRSGICFGREERAFFHHRQVHWDILRAAASGRYRWVLFSPYMGATGVLLGLMPLHGTRKLLWSESNRWSTGPTSPPMRWLKWALAHRFHAIAVPGERAAEHLYAICPALRALVTIRLPNLVDSTVFRDRVAELRRRRREVRAMLGLEGSDTVILSVGQMEGRKGFDGSLAAFAGEAKGAVYCLLGGGSRLELYRERVRDLGLGERVRLPGEVDEETVARYLAAADWFWHPAVADPSPLVCVEALHAGLPMCISLQTGNLPETLNPGRNGIAFDGESPGAVADALRRMLSTPLMVRAELGAQSLRMAADGFDPERVCREFFDLLRTL